MSGIASCLPVSLWMIASLPPLFPSLVSPCPVMNAACLRLAVLSQSANLTEKNIIAGVGPRNGTTLLSLILSDLFGRGVGPIAARQSIASGEFIWTCRFAVLDIGYYRIYHRHCSVKWIWNIPCPLISNHLNTLKSNLHGCAMMYRATMFSLD